MKTSWSDFVGKLAAFADLPKVLGDLVGAIRAQNTDRSDARTTLVSFPEDIQRQQRAEQDRQYRIQRCIARGSWAAVIAASVYAAIAWFQWHEAHKQTLNSARAWLGYQQVQNSNLPIVIDQVQVVPALSVKAHYVIENFGNGPAIKVIPTFWVEIDKDLTMLKRTAAFICDSSMHFATGTVPREPAVFNPGPMGFILFPKQTYSDSQTWSGGAMQSLKWMFVMGCVAYLDQFKTWHWTRFAVVIGDGNNVISDASPQKLYTLFNDTDETGTKDPF